MAGTRTETDGMGPVEVSDDKLWGAQTQRSLHYFRIGAELMPRELIAAYAILKIACALANQGARPSRWRARRADRQGLR